MWQGWSRGWEGGKGRMLCLPTMKKDKKFTYDGRYEKRLWMELVKRILRYELDVKLV